MSAGRTVQPPEPTFARLQGDRLEQLVGRMDDAVADVDLAVVGGDQHGGPGRERGEQVGDQRVGEAQLGIVEVAEAAFVGDLVDAVVVAVDEPLPRPHWSAASTAMLDGARQPTGSLPRRCASLNAESCSSPCATTGTRSPRNGWNGCTDDGGWDGGPAVARPPTAARSSPRRRAASGSRRDRARPGSARW